MRFSVDTGGTFTDLVIEDDDGKLSLHKSSTVPDDPVRGILDVFEVAAEARGSSRERLLGGGDTLIHGTTRGLNAILTGTTARTAFLTTEGHPDILLLREGGRTDVFNSRQAYPDPYIPRSLTWEVEERIAADGDVVVPLNEASLDRIVTQLRAAEIEAIAVCLLWSIVNPAHELRVGEYLAAHLPGVEVTLSHQLNPCIREYRRASSAAIDASLKPVMSSYILGLRNRLEEAGFDGRVLLVTSSGAALDAEDVAAAPVHSLNSGPSMAPVAGRHFARISAQAETAIVADTGGTSYDVSVVREGRIPWTRESWIGPAYLGHMTGFPSVDVRSVGSGGGSIAHVDEGGLLHVGPESAGADPGPVCYGIGGSRPTTTDACLVLGLLDPDYFLGGRTRLDIDRARQAIAEQIATPLGLGPREAAASILRIATERMVSAIEDITIHEGIDPAKAVLVGGGGAAGFNTVAIGRQLGCGEVIVPPLAPVLSAAGAMISDLSRHFELPFAATDADFDYGSVAEVLTELERRGREFIAASGVSPDRAGIEFSVEARYPHQVWELEVPMAGLRLDSPEQLGALSAAFHRTHREVFAIADEDSAIEFTSWHARARCRISDVIEPEAAVVDAPAGQRTIYLPEFGELSAEVHKLESLEVGLRHYGPAIVETEVTTVVVDPGTIFERCPDGTLRVILSQVGSGSKEER